MERGAWKRGTVVVKRIRSSVPTLICQDKQECYVYNGSELEDDSHVVDVHCSFDHITNKSSWMSKSSPMLMPSVKSKLLLRSCSLCREGRLHARRNRTWAESGNTVFHVPVVTYFMKIPEVISFVNWFANMILVGKWIILRSLRVKRFSRRLNTQAL